MKNKYLFLSVFSLVSGFSFSQDQLARDYAPIRTELQSWDPVRGEWLAESMLAISRNEPIPDRTFPEDFTPSEMLKMVPENSRQSIRNTVENNRNAQNGGLYGQTWSNMSSFMQTPGCKLVSGRSYGDPHLSSFDGKSFSLQTVGEFVLTKSASGNMQVQTRQRADGDDFSLNTAIAMNVAGDRVCIYADITPDADYANPLRVDGRPVRVSNSTYYLAHGGNIRNTGNKYVITWPTGENVICEISKRSKFDFINVTANIYPCTSGYEGLLGNANGRQDDDIDTRNNRYDYAAANRFSTVFGPTASMSNEAEKEYLVYLAKEFGHAWRVTPTTSLFDYGPGQSTELFTDYSFPRYHRTVRDLSQQQRDNARRDCERNGITGSELDGCIFDRAYVNIPPTRKPEHRDPTEGAVLASIDRGRIVRNVNPPTDERDPKPVISTTSSKPVVIGNEGKTTPEAPVPPVVISKPVGDESVGSTKPATKSPAVVAPEKPANVSKPASQPVKVASPSEPERTSRPISKAPVSTPVSSGSSVSGPAPVKPVATPPAPPVEHKPAKNPDPVIVTPKPEKTTPPAPTRQTITVPSTRTATPVIKPSR